MEFLQNVSLAHLQLLINTSAKYQANWTETVGGVVRTRFCGQTDRPTDSLTDRQADSSILPTNFVCGGINISLKIGLVFNPFPNDRFLDSTKLKEFAADNFQI